MDLSFSYTNHFIWSVCQNGSEYFAERNSVAGYGLKATNSLNIDLTSLKAPYLTGNFSLEKILVQKEACFVFQHGFAWVTHWMNLKLHQASSHLQCEQSNPWNVYRGKLESKLLHSFPCGMKKCDISDWQRRKLINNMQTLTICQDWYSAIGTSRYNNTVSS